MYSRGVSEEVLGRALKDSRTRDQLVIATKVFYPVTDGPNTAACRASTCCDAIDASLRGSAPTTSTSTRSTASIHDTPIEETLEALHDIVKAGKARYIGASSMFAWQFMKMLALADAHGWTRFVSMQNHYNLVYREEEREMMPLCATRASA